MGINSIRDRPPAPKAANSACLGNEQNGPGSEIKTVDISDSPLPSLPCLPRFECTSPTVSKVSAACVTSDEVRNARNSLDETFGTDC